MAATLQIMQGGVAAGTVATVAIAWGLYAEVGIILHFYSFLWPPSSKSMPVLLGIALAYLVCVQQVFFSSRETEESKRVRLVKKRLLLAQMTQALKWDEDAPTPEEEEEEEEKDKDKKEKKRPPSATELFEMVFDDIEERHVTAYGIDAKTEPYKSVLALFKDRLVEDFEEAVKYTELARTSLEKVDDTLDGDDLKRIAEFRDGTKLHDLLELWDKKIRKRFGRSFASKKAVQAARECDKATAKAQRRGMMTLIDILIPLMPYYAGSLVLMIFDSVTGACLWHSMSTILDGVNSGTMTMEELKWVSVRNYIKFIFCVFAHMGSWAFTGKVTSSFRVKVRSEVMRTLLRQDIAFFDIFPSGVLQERLNNDAEQLSSKLFELPIRALHNMCMLVSNLFVVYCLKPRLFGLIFLPLPVVSVAQYFCIKYMEDLSNRQRKIGEHSAASTMEVLKEIRTVREFAMETEEADRFAASSSYRAGIETFGTAMEHIVFLSPLVCSMIAVRVLTTYFCGSYVEVHELTVGQAVQIAFAADHLQHCIRDLMFLTPDILKVLTPMGRVCDMLNSKPKIEPLPDSPPKFKPDSYEGRIVFTNVDFTFPSEPNKQILFSLSFRIDPGEKVAFVGSTGCGKSTSLRLIERFYEPDAGTITLDGRPIQDYDVHHLRQHMSVVAQDNVLFSTTLRENIIYGLQREVRESITDEEIEQACKKANAWTFIQDFPRKLETYAGERGVKLSGGQKQRLAIARAIIRKPTLVLLDEATSALDSKAEGVVQAALDKMIEANKTGCTIMIAHRLATVKSCDRIMVMDKGRLVEQGSHDELLKIEITKKPDGSLLTGWYHDLWDTQMGKSSGAGSDKDQIAALEKRVAELEAENRRMRLFSVNLGSPVKQKLGHIRRNDFVPMEKPDLMRAVSGKNEDAEPAPLQLQRHRTAF